MNSEQLFQRAKIHIPGGVNSPVRAFKAVGGNPIFVKTGKGAKITTAEGKELLDFCGSWGPLILGHARDEVVEAICRAASAGTSFGINTPAEVEMAEFICDNVSSIEMVRLVNSGTEAVMSAIRVARGYTGRTEIVKFSGCYHGHSDSLLVAAGSGLLTQGKLSSEGVPASVTDEIHILPYNDPQAVRDLFAERGEDIAAVIVEPSAGNMGLIPSKEGFLETLREITEQYGAVLIFDEVITGFRFGPTTYSDLHNIKPDLTTLGKIIGGGMPIGAVGGKREIMEKFAPIGGVYQAGTLSGNPVAIAAGLATLKILIRDNPYSRIAEMGQRLEQKMKAVIDDSSIVLNFKVIAGLFTPFFTAKEPVCYDEVCSCNTSIFARFFHGMLDRGIYLSPSQFEVNFISAAHTDVDIDYFVETAAGVLKEMS